jgi:phenylpropionate dioxygenase-like ring-hydroxylating dioxygenase large terminal subunit
MTTGDQNALLTRTGPGTPMGELFRRYWIPALTSEDLPEPDCPQVRVTLLSERLIAFRDSAGRVGLVEEFCPHRGVSLWFGRNEEGGLRCAYHGWKFDVTGRCLEIPSEPEGSPVCARVKLRAYPCVESGGVIWTYMGPPEAQPPLPAFEWTALGPEHRYISRRWQECNYLQAMEGGIDSSHVSFLHSSDLHADPLHKSTKGASYQSDRMPKFEIAPSPGGLLIGARRNAENGSHYWRVTQWIMPWYTMIPPYGENALNGHAWVPIDDENCVTWTMTYHPTRPLTAQEMEAMRAGRGIHTKVIPGTIRPVVNKDNDYMMDRAAQKSGRTYSGVAGIAMQDASLQESMGPVQDRSRETLVATDAAIVMARRRLLKALASMEAGEELPGLAPDCHRVRPASFVLPADVPFQDVHSDALVATEGVAHTSI